MKSSFLEMPIGHGEKLAWLEVQIASGPLFDLIAELGVIHDVDIDDNPTDEELNDALDGMWDIVRKDGIKCLSEESVGKLLSQPTLLGLLQERVFAEGGAYWNDLIRPEPVSRTQLARLLDSLEHEKGNKTPAPKDRSVRFWQGATAISTLLALAASVLLAVTMGSKTGADPALVSGWALADESITSQDSPSRRQHWNSLAEAADQWRERKASTELDLEKKIVEYKIGCGLAAVAQHSPFVQDDVDDLREMLGTCVQVLERCRQDLLGGKLIDVVEANADSAVAELVVGLKQKGSQSFEI